MLGSLEIPRSFRGTRDRILIYHYYLSQRENFELSWLFWLPYLVLMEKFELLLLGGWRTED